MICAPARPDSVPYRHQAERFQNSVFLGAFAVRPVPTDRNMDQDDYASIQQRLGLAQALPIEPIWSAEPAFLNLLIDHCRTEQPQTIVECSSGLSTLVLARCCQLNGGGRVISMENGEEYAAKTVAELAEFGLSEWAQVIRAPLRTYRLGADDYLWYDTERLPELAIDLLVIDGPPGFIQRHSRYPALPLLRKRLAPGCRLFLDDAARPDEQEILGRWQAELPGLSQDYRTTERGCAILSLAPA